LLTILIPALQVAPPFREAEFDMTFGKGTDKLAELVDLGTELGLLAKAGSWYSLASTGDRIGQGKEATRTYLATHPDVMEDLEKQVRTAIAAGHVDAPKAEYDVDPEVAEERLIELDEKPLPNEDEAT
jgi:recombination protein RecA